VRSEAAAGTPEEAPPGPSTPVPDRLHHFVVAIGARPPGGPVAVELVEDALSGRWPGGLPGG